MYYEWTVTIPELTGDEERNAYIYVPEEADRDPNARFPVLYMFDGQNLFFENDASYGNSWKIMDYLSEHEIPLIVAALECNHHAETDECGGRLSEYSPFDFTSAHWGTIKGRGKITMDYIVNEFKSYVDRNFPTLPEREYTFIAGSSMGGLMTVYALLEYNDIFSRGAALSPAFGFNPEAASTMIQHSEIGKTVLYMDCGTEELRDRRDWEVYAFMTALLIRKGVMLDSRIVPDGIHSEITWQKSVPFFIRTLFYEL